VRINGKLHCLWRAVDQDGDLINIWVQQHRDRPAMTVPLPAITDPEIDESFSNDNESVNDGGRLTPSRPQSPLSRFSVRQELLRQRVGLDRGCAVNSGKKNQGSVALTHVVRRVGT
jgi:DDE domain